jgi:hypothetical protein
VAVDNKNHLMVDYNVTNAPADNFSSVLWL